MKLLKTAALILAALTVIPLAVSCTVEDVTTETDTTNEITTAKETEEMTTDTEEEIQTETEEPKEPTDKPEILGTAMLSEGKLLVYGSAEPDSVIRTVINGNEMKNKCKDRYFYIQLDLDKKSEISVYATAEGKSESEAATVTAKPSEYGDSVWGGKDSRLFYMPTLSFLTGRRADENVQSSINQIVNMITGRTIGKIQELTGKKTKLIFAIIPDPATAYYQEQFDYIQKDVLDPETSIMEAFNKTLNGKHEDVYAVDLLPTMREHKDESIYFSTDTHYTELGAYYAYLEIMKTVKNDHPDATVRTIENGDYTVSYHDVPGGDMCGMAGLAMNEVVPFFIAKFEDTGTYYRSKRNDGIKAAGFGPGNWERNSKLKDSGNPTVYFMGDSYGCYILPFIGANFSEVWTNEGVLWNYGLSADILSQNKPDYVILLLCQRNISGNFLGNSIGQFAMSLS